MAGGLHHSQPLGGVIAAPLQDWAHGAVLDCLARELAGSYSLDFSDVRLALDEMPPNFAHMFDSPQGWTAIAHVIAGAGRPAYLPEVH